MRYSPVASSSRGVCGIVCNDDTRIMMDVGISWDTVMKYSDKLRLSEIDAVLITHHHGDHVKSVRNLVNRGIPIYASAETRHHLAIESIAECQAGVEFNINSLKIMPFALPHGELQTHGYLISDGKKTLCYATDTSHFPYPLDGINILAVECNHSVFLLDKLFKSGAISVYHKRNLEKHLSIEQVESLLTQSDTSALEEVWLLHLSDLCSNAVEFKERIQKITGVEVYVANR